MPDTLLKSLCTMKGLIKLASYSQWGTYIGSLLDSCKFCSFNLPVSLYLPETYGSNAPSRYCTSSYDCFIFAITLLSLTTPRISFSGLSRFLPHWAVIKLVLILHNFIFFHVFELLLANLIMHYFVFWRFIL